jgi:hypothetical protein
MIGENAPRMDVYKDPKKIEEEIDREILESLKKDTPWATNLDWKNYKDNLPKNDEEFRERLLEISRLIQKAIDERKAAEPDAILVGSNGQLLQLYGKATTHDWVVWYVNEFKKGKL